MRRILPLLVLLAACSDSGTGPDESQGLSIYLEAERASEAVLTVGETLRLTSRGGGSASLVVWRSENPGVVSVAPEPDGSVYVRGEAEGGTRVFATAGALADTVVLTVLSADSGASCSGPGLALTPGQTLTTSAAAIPLLCLAAAASGSADYLVVPFNAAQGTQRLRVELTDEGATTARVSESGTPDPARSQQGPVRVRDTGSDFERALRERETRDLSGLVQQVGGPRQSAQPLASVVPALGDTLRINVNAQQTCTSPIERRARVVAVGTHAIFLEDTSNPAGGFTEADYRSFASTYDQLVHPTVTENFGQPTDIDNNGRVLVLFTRAVNELTAVGSEAYIGGFFYARDLFPTRDSDGLRGCAASNVAEILYMLAPDPTGAAGQAWSRAAVAEKTPAVIAHELQHLINASRRLRVLGTSNWNEEFWLNEGLSHIAEELVFYAATPFSPRQEITITALRSGVGTLSAFNQHLSSNFGRLSNHLRRPDDSSPMSGSGLATRGASWAFLRYSADRLGGAEATFWRRLVDSSATGYANLMGAIAASPATWMHDWAVSLYVDDLLQVAPHFRQPSWHFRSIMPALSSNANAYPLTVLDLRTGEGEWVQYDLAAGGAGMVRVRVGAGEAPRLRFTSAGAPPPAALRYTVVRLR